jgi:hypothetical protein
MAVKSLCFVKRVALNDLKIALEQALNMLMLA